MEKWAPDGKGQNVSGEDEGASVILSVSLGAGCAVTIILFMIGWGMLVDELLHVWGDVVAGLIHGFHSLIGICAS